MEKEDLKKNNIKGISFKKMKSITPTKNIKKQITINSYGRNNKSDHYQLGQKQKYLHSSPINYNKIESGNNANNHNFTNFI